MRRDLRLFVVLTVALFLVVGILPASPAGAAWYIQYFNQPTAPPAPQPAPNPAPAPTPVPNPTPNPAPATGLSVDEKIMFDLVNGERAKRGLPAFQLDMKLTEIARMKSLDSVKYHYFGHQSPTYGSPWSMLRTQGVQFRKAAENIAYYRDVYRAHAGLMNSPNHVWAILSPDFTRVGIGIVPATSYPGIVVTQEFIQP
ncbi:MAG: CAP domain-containing protein [Firmicutes bacterium]|nr:CAP domain-containing protein [Bacillota bacterium]